ncbi:MAG: GYF domain-containing protein [Pseudomonadota bacterium]
MQFVCNNCKAKYEIPAQRIKGRILKIRCRECGNVIEIRGDALPGAAGPKPDAKKSYKPKTAADKPSSSLLKERFKASFTSGRSSSHSISPAKPVTARPAVKTKADKLLQLAQKAEARAREMKEEEKWYVAIKSSPVGPVNTGKVRHYIRRADLNLSSLVWKEGFNDWKPLGEVPELEVLYRQLESEIPRVSEVDMAATLRRAAAAAQGGAAQKAPDASRPAPQSGKDALAAIKPVVTPGAGLDRLKGPDFDFLPDPGDALEPQEDAGKDDALRGFYVGRIEGQQTMPQMESMRPTFAGEVMPAYGAVADTRVSLGRRLMQSKLFLLLGGATALMAGFLLIIIIMKVQKGKEERAGMAALAAEEAENTVVEEEEEMEEEEGDILAGLIITVEEVLEAEEAEEATKKSTTGQVKKKTTKTDASFKTSVMDMPDIEETSIAKSSLKKKTSTTSSGGGSGSGKNGLTDDEIRTGVKKNSKTIQRCYEKVLGKGMGTDEKIRVKVKVKVGTSGKVTKVKVTEISKYGNFLTPCIESGINTWIFPKSGDPSEFIFPVLLSPKH